MIARARPCVGNDAAVALPSGSAAGTALPQRAGMRPVKEYRQLSPLESVPTENPVINKSAAV